MKKLSKHKREKRLGCSGKVQEGEATCFCMISWRKHSKKQFEVQCSQEEFVRAIRDCIATSRRQEIGIEVGIFRSISMLVIYDISGENSLVYSTLTSGWIDTKIPSSPASVMEQEMVHVRERVSSYLRCYFFWVNHKYLIILLQRNAVECGRRNRFLTK